MGKFKFTPENRSLFSLRSAWPLTQRELAAVLGLKDGNLLSQFESGQKPLSYEYLEEMAAALGVPPEGVEALLFAHRLLWELHDPRAEGAGGPAASPLDPTVGERRRIWRTALAAGWSVAEALFAELARQLRAEKVEQARREAAEAWERLAPVWREEGRDLVTVHPALRTPAFAARVCEASAQAASHRFEDALELAGFAVSIAGQVPGGEARRNRAVGFSRPFVANALRVATEFDAADAELAEAWELWKDGDPSEPELLPEWRLHDLEASLRREQQRFPEALACIKRALALCGGQPAAAAHILLKKEHIFDAMGDTRRALAALEEAAPFVEAAGDPDLLWRFRFKVVNNLCAVERYAEAAKRLPVVREMAIEQGKELDLIRVAWLAAKVDEGEGRIERAVAGFEQVRHDFMAHGLPYEAALSSLDLAVLLLQKRRAAEVKVLAATMAGIFRAKGIAREALAALSTFCKAAREEIATVELARKTIRDVEEARRSAPPSNRKERPRPATA
ncbi:MAG TPA: helix-turn-helix transcriptional regulator [Thermoanaerobaculia bacterium]|nr:helix-turn-helix transcriptional regulator [Thermoanaerobaculia bacterium]